MRVTDEGDRGKRHQQQDYPRDEQTEVRRVGERPGAPAADPVTVPASFGGSAAAVWPWTAPAVIRAAVEDGIPALDSRRSR